MSGDAVNDLDNFDPTKTQADGLETQADGSIADASPENAPSNDQNSSAENNSEPSSLMDYVTKAVPDLKLSEEGDDLLDLSKSDVTAKAGADKQETDQSEQDNGERKPADTDDGQDKDDAEDDETSLVISPKEFQRMNSKTRRKVRELQERAAMLPQLEEPARAAESLNTYLRDNNIDNQSFTTLLGVGAALQRGDFQEFLEAVAPFVHLAQEQLGIILPADLQAQVNAGHITHDGARDVQRQRLELHKRNEELSRRVQQETHHRQERDREFHEQNATTIASAVTTWENSVKAADPDYAQKAAAMKDITRALIAERGVPTNPQEAVQMAQEAYKRVNNFAKQFTPQPRPTAQVPSGIRANSGRTAEPRTLEEAVIQGLRSAQ